MLIDTHVHLDDEKFDEDREDVIARAREAGVRKLITVGTDLPSSRRAVRIAEQYPFIYAVVGVHPHEAASAGENYLQQIEELAGHPRVVAIGEIGLDYYYNFAPPETQHRIFEEQLVLAGRLEMPVVVHSRDADADTLAILREKAASPVVLHCYTGTWQLARLYLEMGFYISLAGVVTFAKSDELRVVAAKIPADRFFLETDAPYLAPVPKRGRRNEPAWITYTAAAVAEVRGMSPKEVAQVSTANAIEFFRLEGVKYDETRA
ncbi:MAG: TatD family hydrolase [Peptococcaceae bacterium]|nr:TatD family hydrolase [Peptococcaceae bacterium]